uniref:Protein Mis18-alpha n=1 Tax=Oreochromis aureus TaxID=47969 RepID=A0A668RKQ0_OREAU
MATRKQLEKSYTKSVNNSTFDASSIDSTTVGEKLFRPTEEEVENGDDGPVVFICAKCKLPVGDSLSWDGSEDDLNQIRLKRVTDNVMIGKENRLYEASKNLVVDLICRGCHSVLGMVYTSTPKNLDHKRFTFCFSVADIDRLYTHNEIEKEEVKSPMQLFNRKDLKNKIFWWFVKVD